MSVLLFWNGGYFAIRSSYFVGETYKAIRFLIEKLAIAVDIGRFYSESWRIIVSEKRYMTCSELP